MAAGLGGCASVTSVDELSEQNRRNTSFAYMLPKAVLPVQLLESRGNFIINAGAPAYVGDPRHTYYVSYRPNPLSSDTVDVTVGDNGLLKTVNVAADDKTGDFLINLAKSYGAIKSFGKESSLQGATLIAQVDIDPDDPVTMRAGEDAIAAAIRIRTAAGIRDNCGAAAAKDEDKVNLCGVYRSLRATRPSVKLTAFAPDLVPQATLPDCRIGVCYRLPVPYRISAGFKIGGDVAVSSVIVPLPNGGPVVATDFSRTPFVNKVINAGFTNGILTSLKVEKPSEAAAVALLPATIIEALFASIADTFTSRESALKAEVAYVNEIQKLEEARSNKETSLLDGRTSIMSVGMGTSEKLQGGDGGVTNQAEASNDGASGGGASGGGASGGGASSGGANPESGPFENQTPDCTRGDCSGD
ncbi:hypothetical protein [Breoghania sp. L-A4]|uniref:hypothetical protein n=1 Tax=Breoghania sp. L-A4 TaxID=2304600 RepID=UPI000E35AD55|nr:hypothetical protein [Breoghania sp. L-A4]AXS40015.1 hypothetical protein D1F64_08020 [Breoghania sp. L-A4]